MKTKENNITEKEYQKRLKAAKAAHTPLSLVKETRESAYQMCNNKWGANMIVVANNYIYFGKMHVEDGELVLYKQGDYGCSSVPKDAEIYWIGMLY